MKKRFLLFFILHSAFYVLHSNGQILYGINNYTEYHVGNLPIVISAPHGGSLTPASIPDRTCNNPTVVTDANTIALANQIDTALYNLTGCRPHIILCNLKRIKLDCNRNIADGACGNAEAETAWTEFQHFVDTAESLADSHYPDKAFYIDLHGHGHTLQHLELGYLYTATELGYTDSVLNTPQYIDDSSIQNLVAANVNGYTNAEMLRGTNALGTLLGNAGYAAVPSYQILSPDTNPYFDGGYNTYTHTCATNGNPVNGVQIECNYTGVRDSYASRKKFADSLAVVLVRYLGMHENLDLTGCATLNVDENSSSGIFIYPNPAHSNFRITFNERLQNAELKITDVTGRIVYAAVLSNQYSVIGGENLKPGIYFVKLRAGGREAEHKLVIE